MGRGVPVFAIRLGQDPYGFIGKFQAFNGLYGEPRKLAEEIFRAFLKNKKTRNKTARISMALFEDSGSFATATARIGYLEELEAWEENFSVRLRASPVSNSQIRGAWGVRDRIEALASRWEQRPLVHHSS